MHDSQDKVEFRGRRVQRKNQSQDSKSVRPPRKFLSVWFRCCHTYGRMNRNPDETAYEGRCPKCGAKVRATIGPGGTDQRIFEAR